MLKVNISTTVTRATVYGIFVISSFECKGKLMLFRINYNFPRKTYYKTKMHCTAQDCISFSFPVKCREKEGKEEVTRNRNWSK